jgi:hypothetical protein
METIGVANFYFVNEKTGKKYQVLAFDRDAGTVRLKGELAEFTERFDKERFKQWGYVLKQS